VTRDIACVLALLDHGVALSAADIADALGCSVSAAYRVAAAMAGEGLAYPNDALAAVPPCRPRGHRQRPVARRVVARLWVGGRWA